MALTQTVEYALRAVVWLAQQTPGQPQTTQQIAAATKVPVSYLPKVFQPLIRGGLVNGQRGLRGGYSLRRDAAGITLLEVVNHVDPLQLIECCPLELEGHRGRLCPLHSLLNQILLAEQKVLSETFIGDLIKDTEALAPLCDRTGLRVCAHQAAQGPDTSDPSTRNPNTAGRSTGTAKPSPRPENSDDATP
ncbi:MAG: Rrf2 family transcriptional regulator [Planctomycetota bacterium]